jgi:hypothetical protein
MLEVIGDYRGSIDEGVMRWDCPFSTDVLTASGRFDYDGEFFYHDVFNDKGECIYTVVAVKRNIYKSNGKNNQTGVH